MLGETSARSERASLAHLLQTVRHAEQHLFTLVHPIVEDAMPATAQQLQYPLFDLAQISGVQRILQLGFVRGNFLCLHFDKALQH